MINPVLNQSGSDHFLINESSRAIVDSERKNVVQDLIEVACANANSLLEKIKPRQKKHNNYDKFVMMRR